MKTGYINPDLMTMGEHLQALKQTTNADALDALANVKPVSNDMQPQIDKARAVYKATKGRTYMRKFSDYADELTKVYVNGLNQIDKVNLHFKVEEDAAKTQADRYTKEYFISLLNEAMQGREAIRQAVKAKADGIKTDFAAQLKDFYTPAAANLDTNELTFIKALGSITPEEAEELHRKYLGNVTMLRALGQIEEVKSAMRESGKRWAVDNNDAEYQIMGRLESQLLWLVSDNTGSREAMKKNYERIRAEAVEAMNNLPIQPATAPNNTTGQVE